MVEKCIDTVKKSNQFDLTRVGETGQSFWNGGSINNCTGYTQITSLNVETKCH